VGVAEKKQELVPEALAFIYAFIELGEPHEYEVHVIILHFGKILVAKAEVLDYVFVVFAEIKIVVQEVQRIDVWEVEIPVLALLGTACDGHAKVVYNPLDEMLLPPDLHLNYEPVANRVLAPYVKNGIPAGFGLASDVWILDNDLRYWVGEFSFKERIEQGDKKVFIAFGCECFLEREIQRELGEFAFRRGCSVLPHTILDGKKGANFQKVRNFATFVTKNVTFF